MSKENIPGAYPPEDDNFPEDDSVNSVAEAKTPEVLPSYLEELDAEFGQRLATLLYARLSAMSETELDFIREDEELRNKAAYAIQELHIDPDAFRFGRYYVTPYMTRDPAIGMLALELAARAQQVDETFQAIAADIAEATGSLHLPGPVKDAYRIAEKIEREYRSAQGGGEISLDALAHRVKDAARCRIVINGDPTIQDEVIIQKIEESGLHIALDGEDQPRIKRGFRHYETEEPLDITSGTAYDDTKVTVTVEVPMRDGGVALCEIAIVTPEMAVATVSEHPIYEIRRSLLDDDRFEAARLNNSLLGLRNEFYSEVSQKISIRLKDNAD